MNEHNDFLFFKATSLSIVSWKERKRGRIPIHGSFSHTQLFLKQKQMVDLKAPGSIL